ncbi:hypothetical protein GS503_09685 [Rhodococcus hoagii]|nr:hypothetical protein [Prescottella equi]
MGTRLDEAHPAEIGLGEPILDSELSGDDVPDLTATDAPVPAPTEAAGAPAIAPRGAATAVADRVPEPEPLTMPLPPRHRRSACPFGVPAACPRPPGTGAAARRASQARRALEARCAAAAEARPSPAPTAKKSRGSRRSGPEHGGDAGSAGAAAAGEDTDRELAAPRSETPAESGPDEADPENPGRHRSGDKAVSVSELLARHRDDD